MARVKPLCAPKVEALLQKIEAGLMFAPPSPHEVLALAECVRLHEAAY